MVFLLVQKLPAADGFENIVVSANEDFDDKAVCIVIIKV